jgi:hypothetical protein
MPLTNGLSREICKIADERYKYIFRKEWCKYHMILTINNEIWLIGLPTGALNFRNNISVYQMKKTINRPIN